MPGIINGAISSAKDQIEDAIGYKRFMELADMASKASNDAFPGQEWDNTQRNAARHSIWTALMANEIGGGTLARLLAKGVGYANEGIGIINGSNLTRDGAIDMRHDLNNNAVGLNTLEELKKNGDPNQQEIIDALIQKARESKIVPAPSVLAPDVGYLTRNR